MAALVQYLTDRQTDLDRWPDDGEWRQAWISRPQYKSARQPRIRYIFEAIEQAKRSALSEDVEIKSALTIEHILPQKWRASWPLPGFADIDPDEADTDWLVRAGERDLCVDTLGNLTLLTQSLNSSVSNGPYSVKMPAVRSHSSLALNRDLYGIDRWDEEAITDRATSLFELARRIWTEPKRNAPVATAGYAAGDYTKLQRIGLPPEGTKCRFTYAGQSFAGVVESGNLVIDGVAKTFGTFSAASQAVTRTSRNGWFDWCIQLADGEWILADEWRKLQTATAA